MDAGRRGFLKAVSLYGGAALLGEGALGCGNDAPAGSEGASASPSSGAAAAASAKASDRPLRIVMSAAFVSEAGVGVYEQIARYLAPRLSRGCEFVTGLAYGTINSMLESGAVDGGFICGLPYVLLHDRPAPLAELVVAPIMRAPRYKGQPKYFSDLVVRKESPYRTLDDLEGRTYAYNELLSNSGYNMPRHRLLELGRTQGFFGKVVRSGSHEESIRMVATGQVDASFVDSLVLDHDREKGLGHAQAVRVVESLGPAGMCPLVASTKLDPAVRGNLRRHLAAMHEDPEGRRILKDALVDRFAVVEDGNYDDIRAMKAAAEKAGFLEIK